MADTVYRVDASAVASRRVGDESVVLDLEQSVYFGLNRIGGELWEKLLAGATPDQLVRCLREQSPEVSEERAHHDVASFLAALRAEGLIHAG